MSALAGRQGGGARDEGTRQTAGHHDGDFIAINLGVDDRSASGDDVSYSLSRRDVIPEPVNDAAIREDVNIQSTCNDDPKPRHDSAGQLDKPPGASSDAASIGCPSSCDNKSAEASQASSAAAADVGRRRDRSLSGKPGKSGPRAAKHAALRTWLRVEKNGETSITQADKWRITHKLGIQTRDLRLLDPNLSTTYPSAILCRDKAIVVNLEHLKAIITTTFVLVVNPEDERVLRFIDDLKGRLAGPVAGMPTSRSYQSLTDNERLKLVPGPSTLGLDLPFELRVLECCLDTTAGHLDFLTQKLEASAYPALDSLANKVSSPNLERVRRIKNNLVRLTTRVETVREVLEKFLDDDSDMHDLNLTAKELHEQEEQRMLAQAQAEAEGDLDVHSMASAACGRHSSDDSSSSASSDSSVEEAETAVVEMLLQAYFMHVDNTYNKLQTLDEYIKDTEDLVNIKLDQQRNQLIIVHLLVTALCTVLAAMTVVAGWFGTNLNSGLQEKPHLFDVVTVLTSCGGLLLLALFVLWLWRSKLLIY